MTIGYVTIGAKDGEASKKFYNAVFAAIGSELKTEGGGWYGYGKEGPGKSMMDCHTAICPQHDGNEARAGNGIMIGYAAPSKEAVKRAYDAGLANGGSDEGGPGYRPPDAQSGFYVAYMRDPTGNKINVFWVG